MFAQAPRRRVVLVLCGLLILGLSGLGARFTYSAFSSTTANPGNSFQAAASFSSCSASTQTLSPARDTYLDQENPTTNFAGTTPLKVRSYEKTSGSGQGPKNARVLLHYDLPAIPSGCVLSSAFLRSDPSIAEVGRTWQVFRVAGSWTETGPTWNSQPATTGAAETATASSWTGWNVTAQVKEMYQGTNNGFLIRDAAEGDVSDRVGTFASREGTNPPKLLVTFAANACTTPEIKTVQTDRDSYVNEGSSATNYGTAARLRVESYLSSNDRTLVYFGLPAVPSGCRLVGGDLRMPLASGVSGRVVDVFRAGSSWTETGLTWANQPATAGSAVTKPVSASIWTDVDVKSHLEAMYQGANNGFLLKDSAEGSSSIGQVQEYYSRESGVRIPELKLPIG